MSIKEAKNLQDSILVFADTTQYKTKLLKNGSASWYGADWNGRLTHSGDTFYNYRHTAASATIPMGTFLKVTNLRNNKVVFVKVNDTFPPWNLRDLDLSEGAAIYLDMIDEGVAKVRIEKIVAIEKKKN